MQISILEYLEKANRKYSERTCYQDEFESVTFREVMEEAKRVGSALCNHTGTKRPIIVIAQKGVHTPALYFGIAYAGCFYVPLGADLPSYRLKIILDIVKSDIIITDGKSDDVIHSLEFAGTIISLKEINQQTVNEESLLSRRKGMLDIDPLYVIFTSGSSGKPKGVVTSHRAVIDYIDVFAKTFGITEDDVFGNQAPLDYIAAIRDMYLPMLTGAKTILIPKGLFSMPQKLFEYIDNSGVTTLCWVSSAMVLCSELNAFDAIRLNKINKVFFTGSVLPCKHLRVWQENLPNARFINHYGPTEVTASCTYYLVDKVVENDDVLPIGIPFNNMEIMLLDDTNQPVKQGDMGEICVIGTGLALGYYRNPEQTKESFILNPLQDIYNEVIYKTGDLGILQEDGNLTFHGRKDFQIKHMGHRIELSEIESVVGALRELHSCCCLYKEEKEQLWLFYTGTIENRELAIHLRGCLPAYMIPRKFVKLEEMPKTFNGKIDMEALKKKMQ